MAAKKADVPNENGAEEKMQDTIKREKNEVTDSSGSNDNVNASKKSAGTENTTTIEDKKKKDSDVIAVDKKDYKGTDLIPCRSVRQGELFFPGTKSDNLYIWAAYGDVTEVEYQDLLSLKASRSRYLTEPFLVIEDPDLLSDPRWKDIKAVYDAMDSVEDIGSLLDMNNSQFERTFTTLPSGLKNAIASEVATRIDNKTFDSIQKIKIIDRVCNTDLTSLL